MSIAYSYDSTGRINGVSGADTLYANVSQYANSFSYRAWGALKNFTDGTNQIISRRYNARLQTNQFSIGAMVQNFDYFNDGRIKFLDNIQDGNFDRSFSYDQEGRLTAAATGGAARQDGGAVPYNQTFGYDAFSNLTARNTSTWNQFVDSDSAVYVNNRRNGWGYDNDGRNISLEERNYYFDAAGQPSRMEAPMWIAALGSYITKIMDSSYDGDGQKVKEVIWDSYNYDPAVTRYYLRSTVLKGAIIAEIDGAGQKQVGYVYAGERVLAKQTANQVTWKHTSPAGTSEYNSTVFGGYARDEFDPFGSDVTLSATAPPENPPAPGEISEGRFGGIMDSRYSDIFDTNGCVVDDMPESCAVAAAMVNFGTGQYRGLLSTTFTMASLAQSLPLRFASTTQLTTTLNVSGTEGRTTYETVWNDEYHEWVPQTPTAYSGMAPMEVSLTLASTVLVPQSTVVTNNRAIIDNKGQGQDCDVSVSFTGDAVNGMKNGENYYHNDPGLGFTVTISGLGAGGIASIGENKVDSKGHWILQQLMNVTYWTLRKGDNDPKTEHVGTFSDHVDPGSIIRSDNKSGGWIDHPGPNLKNGAGQTLVAHHSKWNFLIKAYNGNKECFVGFHAEMTFRDGLFSVHWGPGLY
jgi:hypothetical protein